MEAWRTDTEATACSQTEAVYDRLHRLQPSARPRQCVHAAGSRERASALGSASPGITPPRR